MNMDFWRPKKVSEPDPPTNREWMESLTDEQLVRFVTFGLEVVPIQYPAGKFCLSIHDIGRQYIQTTTGLQAWLNAEQEYRVADGKESEDEGD